MNYINNYKQKPEDPKSKLERKKIEELRKFKKSYDEQCDLIHLEERGLTKDFDRFQQIYSNELTKRENMREEIELFKAKITSLESEIERRTEELSRDDFNIDKYTESPNTTTSL